MAEEKSKKPKIDLKARLGKTTMGPGAGPSVNPAAPSDAFTPPPPMAAPSGDRVSAPPSVRPTPPPPAVSSNSGIAPPPGIAPPSSLVGGNLLNPFAPKPQPKAAPVTAEQQTIKVEVSEELHEERRKASRLSIIVGIAAALVGLGIGFYAGGQNQKANQDKKAIAGADKLEGVVAETGKKVDELEPIFKDIEGALKNKKYPADAVSKLNDFTMPFNSGSLKEANIGSLPADVQTKILVFLRISEEIQDKKKDLANLVAYSKKAFEEMWARWAQKPGAEYGVIFTKKEGGEGKIASELWAFTYDDTPATETEPEKRAPRWDLEAKDWPSEFKMHRIGEKESHNIARYTKGELPGDKPQFVPVDPKTVASFQKDEPIHIPIINLMNAIRMLVAGDDRVNFEKAGIKTECDPLAQQLSKISLKH